MKKSKLIFCFILCLLTFYLPVSADLKTGKLIFGTASEYRPFVYYDDENQLKGLDIELIQTLAKRMNVSVEIVDMAFDGLMDSVNVGQVDIIGGAFSRNAEREKKVLFTDSYYLNKAIMVAKTGSAVPDSLTPQTMDGFKIGVQRGSSFDQYLKTNLVGEGLISSRNIFTYGSADSAMKALSLGSIDLVMLDSDVYELKYKSTENYKVVNRDMGDEEYAFAVASGNKELQSYLNIILRGMQADHSLEKLIDRYTGENAKEEAEVTITRPSQLQIEQSVPVVSQATPIPAPPDQPYQCKNVMIFMSDVSMPDGTSINPGQQFTKTWQIYNNGSCKWYEGYQIVFVDGDYMGGNSTVIPQLTIPGTTVDVSINLTAPETEGTHVGYFQMRAPDGSFFGPKLTAKYFVTRGQVNIPATGANPVITEWSANYYKGHKYFCPTIRWATRNVNSVDLLINNKYITTKGPSGSLELCPPGKKGDFVYGIVAHGTNGKNASLVLTYTSTGESK